ncbi:hypothetical protein [Pseudolactococcus insecticola]|uniref:DUF5648 domain-containing protein n=1 Tax=Pseudolactococcus insecticola TaxID=2709158 RepID=A0A6A0B796_9LACT|nr:hypothetical protein [Lactococcus insecticola]GFH40816.1 hypothetical protein Hs20B_12140 [Lactococcus insecticola]
MKIRKILSVGAVGLILLAGGALGTAKAHASAVTDADAKYQAAASAYEKAESVYEKNKTAANYDAAMKLYDVQSKLYDTYIAAVKAEAAAEKAADEANPNSMVNQIKRMNSSFDFYNNHTWQTLYRMYNPNSGEHFYTLNANEVKSLYKVGWKFEGTSGLLVSKSKTPVYRVYNPNAGDHHYTSDKGEKDALVKLGWRYEGISWYSNTEAPAKDNVYRLYNPNAKKAGAHHYTANYGEVQLLVSKGWKFEGTSFYIVDPQIPNGQAIDGKTPQEALDSYKLGRELGDPVYSNRGWTEFKKENKLNY